MAIEGSTGHPGSRQVTLGVPDVAVPTRPPGAAWLSWRYPSEVRGFRLSATKHHRRSGMPDACIDRENGRKKGVARMQTALISMPFA
jgi:hypothetical protein